MLGADDNKGKRKDTNRGSTGLRIWVYIKHDSLANVSALAVSTFRTSQHEDPRKYDQSIIRCLLRSYCSNGFSTLEGIALSRSKTNTR
jgi:hypothetical protein